MPGVISVTTHLVEPVILYGTLKVTVVAPLLPTSNVPQTHAASRPG